MDVLKAGRESEALTPDLAHALKLLWSDKAVQEAYSEKRLEFHLHESSKQSVPGLYKQLLYYI